MSFNKGQRANRLYHYSIRKTSLGVGSVVVGLFLTGILSKPVEVSAMENSLSETRLVDKEITADQPVETAEAPKSEVSVVDTKEEELLTQALPVAGTERSDETTEATVVTTSVSSPESWQKVNHFTETDRSINFDNDWKFNLGDSTGAAEKSFDDSGWDKLNLPHDFSINQDYSKAGEAESGYKLGGTGWYRKSFTVSDKAANSRVSIHFDGSYMETEVFINGTSLGVHPYGYNAFSFDLTDHLKANEENLLAIKVVNKNPSSRWYSGSGIYRSVHLNFEPTVHFDEFGVSVTTPDLETTHDKATGVTVNVTAEVINKDIQERKVSLKTTLLERRANGTTGDVVATSELSETKSLAANTEAKLATNLKVVKPKLWSTTTPNLYIVRTELYQDGQLIQTKEQETGFRYTKFDSKKGFSLNGVATKLQGVSMHHDQGSLGASAYYDAIERQVEILKEMGVNAIRVTHNPSSKALRDIANRKGMLLIDEAFDTWLYAKNGNIYDYARYFNQPIGDVATSLASAKSTQTWAEYHIKQMVRAAKNDPSVIMYSTGNEVMEGAAGDFSSYPQLIAQLMEWIHQEDPTRPATLGDNKLKAKWRESIGMANALTNGKVKGIVGYNYADGSQYDEAHREHPEWIIYGSETASSVNSRGVYDVKGNTRRSDKQLSSYDQSRVGWGHLASMAWYDTIVRDFVAGEFVWTGFDYLGEPTPWNNVGSGGDSPKSSYFGIVDTAGFPKDSYYFYASQWKKDQTTLHILPAWEENVVKKDRNGNVEVVVYSSAAKVKLLFIDENGQETVIGEKAFTKKQTPAGHSYQVYEGADKQAEAHKNLYLTWQVPYRKGTIKAIAYDEKGAVITDTFGTSSLSSFTSATRLSSKVRTDKEVTDHSLAYVEIDVLDKDGNLVVNSDTPITVSVTGVGELLALDNGNANDFQSYTDNNRKAFSGKLVAIARMTGETGNVTVTAQADGLAEAVSTFDVTGLKKVDASVIDSYLASKTIYVKKGSMLNLPTTTKIRYADGREVEKALTFDQAAVNRDMAKGTSFTARGRIADTNLDAEIVVAVIDQIASMKNISQAVELGSELELPKTVQAYLADGNVVSAQFPVVWQQPTKEQLSTEGTFTLIGKANVLGESYPVTATIRVARKKVTVDQNVAPVAVSVVEDTVGEKSDTLSAINDGEYELSPNLDGGPNESIWSNFASAQNGDKTSTLTFTYDTAQNISEVTIAYARDSYALALPKSTTFSWSRGKGEGTEAIAATASEVQEDGNISVITYSLAHPVPAVEFKVHIENADQSPGRGKATTGIIEVELMTAIESFNRNNEACLSELVIGDRVFRGRQITTTMDVPKTDGPFRASNTDKNVAVTILPVKDNVLKIFTESEDKSKSLVYTINLIPESPSDNYVPVKETRLIAGSIDSHASEALEHASDNNYNTIWHTDWSGTNKDNLWITIDTGKERQLDGFAYMARKDSPNGKVTDYEIYTSLDNQNWTKVTDGSFEDKLDWQEATFTPTAARYVRLKALHTLGDGGRPDRFMSAAEVRARQVKPTETDQPSQPAPVQPVPSQPTTPVTDGTVALPDSWTAPEKADNNAVDTALRQVLNKEYTIYPTVQGVSYGNGAIRLDQTVNIVIGEGIDIYTLNRLKETLQANNISYTTSGSVVANASNIVLGIAGQDTVASQHQSGSNISNTLYDKIDAYSLVIKDNVISVVGKDTDAVFYGLTTLKHMFKDSDQPVLRELKVEDFADVKNRGFIEGYYGNPWSIEDRIELMRFGGDLKMTQYFFAPKDDAYHNSQWRDLYPEESLEGIRALARSGNQSKTRFVYTLHPFMHNAIRFDENYDSDLAVIKAKFTQLMDAGVREFGILADDAARPQGGFNSYNRLMKDLTDWLTEKATTYPGLQKDMIFVPHEYWGRGTEPELRALNNNLPDSTSMVLTGGKIWGEASTNFLGNLKQNLTADGSTYKPVTLWLNWPCTDNSKEHLILGGGEKFLHPNVDPSLISGIMLNPMQQSEPSKIALFSAAEYTWKIWKSEAEAKKVNDIAFNFANHGTFKDTEASVAFRELGKHMINQNMDSRVVKLEESVELAPKLADFLNKLKAGEDVTAARQELRGEFAKLKTAAETYKTSGNERLRDQIVYWLDNTIDQMDALDKLLTATEATLTKQGQKVLWDNYKAGRDLYAKSKTHEFRYVNEMKSAELGVQHIRPFILALHKYLETRIEETLDPSKVLTSFITNRTVSGDLSQITDGDLSTQMLSSNPASIAVGDYVGLEFNKVIDLNSVIFAMGAVSNLRDTFSEADVEYLNEAGEWVKVPDNYTGNETVLTFENLNLKAKGIRLIATTPKDNTWLGIREIAVNRPLETKTSSAHEGTFSHSDNLVVKQGRGINFATDGKAGTETWLANRTGANDTPTGAWVQLAFEGLTDITSISIVQGDGDKLDTGALEYTTNGQDWTKIKDVQGEQTVSHNGLVKATAIRLRNTSDMPKWWRVKEFTVETKRGVTDFTDTNVDSLKSTTTEASLGHYDMTLTSDATLKPGDYIGIKLDRLHELSEVSVEGDTALSLLYSPNLVEWYSKDKVADQNLVRYVRLVNQTGSNQTIGASHLIVRTAEVEPASLVSSDISIHPVYASADVRNRGNLIDLFDGKLTDHVEFSNFPQAGNAVVINLGDTRRVKKIRAYIQDATVNYLRDGKIQVSADGQTWTDVITVGDGQPNAAKDDSLSDGWTHDATNPGNRYIEGSLETPVTAKYLRIYATANYDHRFLAFTEMVISDGEFVKTVNNPTVTGQASETNGSLLVNIVDKKLETSYQSDGKPGLLTYHLSENNHHNRIVIASNIGSGHQVTAKVRVAKAADTYDQAVKTEWIELGLVTNSFQVFSLPEDVKYLLDVQLEWQDKAIEIYELSSYYSDPSDDQFTQTTVDVTEKRTRQETRDVDFKTVTKEDATLAAGTRVVDQVGQKGSITETYEDTYVNGQLVDSKLVDTKETAATDEHVRVGTRVDTPKTARPNTAPTVAELPIGHVPEQTVAVPKTAPTIEELPVATLSDMVSGVELSSEETSLNKEEVSQATYSRVDKHHVLPKTASDNGLLLTALGGLLSTLGLASYRRKK